MASALSHWILKWMAQAYHLSIVVGTVSMPFIRFMRGAGIPLDKKLMRVSAWVISLRVTWFLNWEM